MTIDVPEAIGEANGDVYASGTLMVPHAAYAAFGSKSAKAMTASHFRQTPAMRETAPWPRGAVARDTWNPLCDSQLRGMHARFVAVCCYALSIIGRPLFQVSPIRSSLPARSARRKKRRIPAE